MSMTPLDTTEPAREAQLSAWRRMGGERRLQLALQMSDEIRGIAADGIQHRHPEYTEAEVRWALLRMVLGDDLFSKAFAHAPLLDP